MTQLQQQLSPEIREDGRVTFRLWAPEAEAVMVRNTTGGYGDWPDGNEVPMAQDEQGVWSATIGPLAPEYYTYVFVINGVQALDPANWFIMRDGIRYSSSLRVPGPTSALYDVNDVPHGTLAQVWYPSPSMELTRRMYIYTPPGYEAGDDRYPVLYLLHGGGSDEDAWTNMGRAPQILDNLLAQGKIRPMIVVMTNGSPVQKASPDFVSPPPGWRPGPPATTTSGRPGILRFPDSLVKDVIPFVDARYRTLADREHRAIAGLSMGGAQTMYAAFSNLDWFAWVGVFSGGFPLLPGVSVEIPAPANAAQLRGPDITRTLDPDKFAALVPNIEASVNARLRLFYLAIGTEDGLITTHGALKKLLDARGVRYDLVERAGYAHEWRFWRLCLADLAQKLFRQ